MRIGSIIRIYEGEKMVKKREVLNSIGIITLYLFAILTSALGNLGISLVINIISSLLMFFYIKRQNGEYSSVPIIFYAFSFLYGVSGPINVLWGEGMHPIFGNEFNVAAYLIAYSLANIGMVVGMFFFSITNFNKNKNKFFNDNLYFYLERNNDKLINHSIFIAVLLFIGEIINYVRVGGFSTIAMSKAVYQSKLSGLTLTFPSDILVSIIVSLLALHFSISKLSKLNIRKVKVFLVILLMQPYIIISLLLGQRGKLLSMFLIYIIGRSVWNPIKKIKPKLLISVILFYFLMSFLYANRPILSTIVTDPSYFFNTAFNKEKLVSALNPGGSEFGAPFGNFNKFYVGKNESYNLLLGKTYILSLISSIPSFLYPGTKPLQITYIFRNRFFSSEAKRGAIAGTAFSSILEAYWNFGFIGILLMYALFFYVLMYFESNFKTKSFTRLILYLSLVPITKGFHRSGFNVITGNLFLNTIVILLVVYLYKAFFYIEK